MLARKLVPIAVLAAVVGTPLAAMAEGFVPSNGDASYVWEGPRYNFVNGHLQRVDEPAPRAATISGFMGTPKHAATQVSSSDKNAFGSTDGDSRFNNGIESN